MSSLDSPFQPLLVEWSLCELAVWEECFTHLGLFNAGMSLPYGDLWRILSLDTAVATLSGRVNNILLSPSQMSPSDDPVALHHCHLSSAQTLTGMP